MPVSHLIEYRRYRVIIEKALDQVLDDDLNRILVAGGNSIAMMMRHLSGNLSSRFTDFLFTDGEKPWRNREQEFKEGPFTRKEIQDKWVKTWSLVETTLQSLTKDDLPQLVIIRGVSLSVEEALNRSVAHLAYHAGQIVLLARMFNENEWQWISIPKGKSDEYNPKPDLEKSPEKRSL
ncbi:MAG: DUF1572 family protein [Rhodothermales bacterium]